jgi:N-hydroxyarylamine O-acetyltransferase
VSSVDLDAYFERVGYGGPCNATVEVLRELHALHPAAIPFEAIDVFLGGLVDLSPQTIDAKLIHGGRGGYCFEQNSLFARVLRTLGFEVEPLIARALWGRTLDDLRPRSHMALRVRAEGEDWLADVGLGVCTLTAPLRLEERGAQPTLFESMRLRPSPCGELRLEALLSGEWRPVYDLSLAPQLDVDFVSANWYVSTHPDSPFRQRLIVSRTTGEARLGLVDNRLAIRRLGEPAELRVLTAHGLARSLERDFGLEVDPAWTPALARAVEAAAA